MTAEARAAIERADVVFHLMAEPVAEGWLEHIRPDARSLAGHYQPERHRNEIYGAIADEIVEAVEAGADVCVAFYGHPGMFVVPAHEAIRRVREAGFDARMQPGISALDCLVADLGVDPAPSGLQSYEATEFLLRRPVVDTAAALVLWQVSVIGESVPVNAPNQERLRVLADYLCELYPPSHEGLLYEASPYPIGDPIIRTAQLRELGDLELTPLATLYVPPARTLRSDPEMLERLRLRGQA
jgi:uncharacterized protein YabN with tetrapyrrole methylase and pyrophosphatase domain